MPTKKQIAAVIIIGVAVLAAIILLVLTNVLGGAGASSSACPKCPICPSCGGTVVSPKPTPAPAKPTTAAPAKPVVAPAKPCVPGCTTDGGHRYVGAASENINGPGGIRLNSAAECKTRCEAEPKCLQYVYFQPNKLCYLETTLHNDPPIADARFTSGYCKRC